MQKVELNKIEEYLNSCGFEFQIEGEKDIIVEGFSSISNYKDKTMTWLRDEKSVDDSIREKTILLCIVQEGVEIEARTKIISKIPRTIFFSVLTQFWDDMDEGQQPIGQGTVIGKQVQVGNNVQIGSNCSLSGKINIGDNTVIGDNVVIRNRVNIGHDCQIQSMVVIGEDGFGYIEDENHKKEMIKHHGGVSIGNEVFIGSHVNIARGVIDDTIIEDGVKIAPSSHIGHNGHIEKNASVVCSKLFGSVKVEENAYIASSVIRNQVTIGKNTLIGMGSVVTKDIDSNKIVYGNPARVIKDI